MSDERFTGLGAKLAKILAEEAKEKEKPVPNVAIPGVWISRRRLLVIGIISALVAVSSGWWVVRKWEQAEARRLEAIWQVQNEIRFQAERKRIYDDFREQQRRADQEFQRREDEERRRIERMNAEFNRWADEDRRRRDLIIWGR